MAHFRFVHAADLHLDTPFEGIGRASPEIAQQLRDTSLAVFDSLIDLAIERGALFVVLAGDIYDGPQRGIRAQIRFLRGMERLAARGIRVFVVHGNHDPVEEGWSAIRAWPEGVRIFRASDVESIPVLHDGTQVATVHGISYPRSEVTENLALRFPRTATSGFHIGILHCNIGGNTLHASYSPCSIDDLRRSSMHYWALGHIHAHQILQEHNPCIVYSGSLQGRSPKLSEQGSKGAVVVEVADDTLLAVDFVPLDRIRFVSLSVDATEAADVPDLFRRLSGAARAAQYEHSGRALVIQVRIAGRTPLHVELRHAGLVQEMLAQLREDFSTTTPFVWWNTVQIETLPPTDRDAIRRRGDFTAELLRVGEELAQDEVRFAQFWDEQMSGLETTWLRSVDCQSRWPGGTDALGARGRRDMPSPARERNRHVKIRGWHIDGFGIFRDHAVRDLPDGLTVVFGLNEAGKSTLLAFLRGVLFGFPDARSRESRYPPLRGGRHGGRLFLETDGGSYVVEREVGRRNSLLVTLPSGLPGTEDELAGILGHVDGAVFRNVFAFSLKELEDFDKLGSDGIRERIFSAGVVGAGRTAQEVLSDLERRSMELLRNRGSSRITALIGELQQRRRELSNAQSNARAYHDRIVAEEAAQGEKERLRDAIEHEQRMIQQSSMLKELWPTWHRRAQALREMAQLPPLDGLPDDAEARLERISERLRLAEEQHERLAAEQQADEGALAVLDLDDAVWAAASDIEALDRTVALQRSRLEQVQSFVLQVDAQRSKLNRVIADLGPDWDTNRAAAFDRSIPKTEEVRVWEVSLTEASRRVEEAEAACERLRLEIEGHAARRVQLESQRADISEPPSSADLAERDSTLRRLRAAIEELREAERTVLARATVRDDRERVHKSLRVQDPFRPPGQALQVPWATAVALAIIAGWQLWRGEFVWSLIMAAFAALFMVLASVVRRYGQHVSGRLQQWQAELAAVQEALERAEADLREAQEVRTRWAQRVEAEAQTVSLGPESTFDDVEVATAVLERAKADRQMFDALVQQLEDVQRLHEAAAENLEQASEQAETAHQQLRTLQEQWKSWKVAAGVPENLSAQGVLDFFEQIRVARDMTLTLNETERQLVQVRSEVETWEARGRQALQSVGVTEVAAGDALLEHIRMLSQRLQVARQNREQARALQRSLDRRRPNIQLVEEQIQAAQVELKSLLEEAGAADERDLRHRAALSGRRSELLDTVSQSDQQVLDRIGQDRAAEQMKAELERGAVGEWEAQIVDSERRLSELRDQYDQTVKALRDAELAREHLEEAADIPAIQLEVAALEEELAQAVTNWRVLALAEGLISETLSEYERRRQPAVLDEASRIFAQITDGRYVRVVQRVGTGTFDVLDAAGGRRAPEALSRGTLEQLYLAVRLGLAKDLADRTAVLPYSPGLATG